MLDIKLLCTNLRVVSCIRGRERERERERERGERKGGRKQKDKCR